jgi:hypothetical protein
MRVSWTREPRSLDGLASPKEKALLRKVPIVVSPGFSPAPPDWETRPGEPTGRGGQREKWQGSGLLLRRLWPQRLALEAAVASPDAAGDGA